jgi:23S rRNA (cytidine1920-2'-O)/16S rRNA (cytidine1409-2'-O)-methyltransferase
MVRKRIDRLLVERGLFESRAKAQDAIEAGGVRVGGVAVLKASDTVDEDAEIAAEPAHGWVGRGALKLAHALALWPVSPDRRVVLDIGASTGGFTEVCLKGGARRVYAVDVGRGQLHPRIASDPRVVNLEGVDARALDRGVIDEEPSLIVCDASFIGLEKVLPVPLALAAPGADLIALVKPQFQLGPGRVGKGGVVKDEAARLEALASVSAFLQASGWTVRATAPSPISGGDGNIECLLWAQRPAQNG